MSTILSSTFSINMLSGNCTAAFETLTVEEFKVAVKTIDNNVVNPRHTSTAALVSKCTDLPCAGGFANVEAGDTVVVILPPRSLMSRDGTEITMEDLSSCQFWTVTLS